MEYNQESEHDKRSAELNRLMKEGPDSRSDAPNEETFRPSQSWIYSQNKPTESLDFEETESVMWRKHQLRRFFQDRGHWWTTARRTTAWKWGLIVLTGVIIGLMGYFVQYFTAVLTSWKFRIANDFIANELWANAFFSFLALCLFFALLAGLLCWYEPNAAGSGIPEIKAYLNGVNLNKLVRIRVLFTKVLGMCLSCSASLPIGKEGPMIHAGSIVGAAVSQGKTITLGFDTSWTKFQDLRNDRSKRDFVTFGAAAGVAAAFSAPIGGILFTLEEGASFWSTTLTFRAFFCAMITQLVFTLVNSGAGDNLLGTNLQNGIFAFGSFNFNGYYSYELVLFSLMGAAGGLMGAFFNAINREVAILRMKYLTTKWKQLAELMVITFLFAIVTFTFPLMWTVCTDLPTDTAGWTSEEQTLMGKLVQFQCKTNQYNQVASLYFTDSDTAMQQLFHFSEVNGSNYTTFTTGALLMFFIPYFLFAAVTSGTFCPAGLFIPTLFAGAAYGRIIGHILNCAAPGFVTDSGTYALIGAASLLGGMSRMTIAGTIIILEATGNPGLLLPLMLTFAAARYSGNAINEAMYDMMIELKEMPFLEGSLKTLGLLNYHPVTEIMARPVHTLYEINRVGTIYDLLKKTRHNGFPVVGKDGHLRGLILRKHLCSLLKLKAFSTPIKQSDENSNLSKLELTPAAAVFHDTLERNYPRYPKIDDIELSLDEMNCWMDIRAYMDTAVYSINESSSIQKSYRFFRTMGLRHLVVVDGDHKVTGIITRHDITEHRLEHHWFNEGDNLQKFINVGPVEPSHLESVGLLKSQGSDMNSTDDLSSTATAIDKDKDRYSKKGYYDQTNERENITSAAASTTASTASYTKPSMVVNPTSPRDDSTTTAPSASYLSTSSSRPRDSRSMREPKSSKPMI